MKEIEAKLTYTDRGKLCQRLGELGCKKRESVKLVDTYYSPDGDRMDNVKTILRIREISGKPTELTYKGPCPKDKTVWERTEITTEISSPQEMREILDNLQLNLVKSNETAREYWELDDFEIVFMDFIKPKKLEIIEIEGPTTEKVEQFIVDLGSLVEVVGEEVFKTFDES
jgi:predicted adenylyl cyclase CyaB